MIQAYGFLESNDEFYEVISSILFLFHDNLHIIVKMFNLFVNRLIYEMNMVGIYPILFLSFLYIYHEDYVSVYHGRI